MPLEDALGYEAQGQHMGARLEQRPEQAFEAMHWNAGPGTPHA